MHHSVSNEADVVVTMQVLAANLIAESEKNEETIVRPRIGRKA